MRVCRRSIVLVVAIVLLLWGAMAQAQPTGGRGVVQPGGAPAVTNLSVSSGAAGASVTITGTGFGATQGSSSVTFNKIAAAVSSWGDTSITAAVPENATTGSLLVIVGGIPSNANTFTIAPPTVSNLSVTTGSAGTPVTITGTNYGTTQGLSTITFNGVTATVTSWGSTSVDVTVPSGATTGNVVVTVAGAQSNATAFTVPGAAPNPIAASRLPCGSADVPNPCWAAAGATIVASRPVCTSMGTPGQLRTFVQSVTAAQINSAIAACPVEMAVFLNTGTYNLTGAILILKNFVTLRGAGADNTIVNINSGSVSGCGLGSLTFVIRICAGGLNIGSTTGGGSGPRNSATWTGTAAGASLYPQGSSVVTFSNVTGLQVDSVVFLDQLHDAGDGWPAQGDIWHDDDTGAGTPVSPSGDYSRQGGRTFPRVGRTHTELHRVTAINGLNVTITPPLLSPDYRASQSPGAWWGNRSGTRDLIEGVGLENLTYDWTGTGGNNIAGVGMINASNSWITGVRGIYRNQTAPFLMHMYLAQSFGLTVRGNYIWGPSILNEGTNNTNYAITPHLTSSLLFENNICHHGTGCFIPNDPDSGSVYGYNFITDQMYQGQVLLHDAGAVAGLVEGNDMANFDADIIHGRHYFWTIFRNLLQQAGSPNQVDQACILLTVGARFFNALGNICGATSWTVYTQNCPGGAGCTINIPAADNAIFSLGHTNDNTGSGQPLPDARVGATLLRWGNWDSVNSKDDNGTCDTTGTRFESSEVPSSIASFSNPVPSSQTLPPSFYLPAAPSWWGAGAWPPHGPDVCNGTVTTLTGGHANKIPARLRFEAGAGTLDPLYPSTSPRIRLNMTVP